jgi:cysteine desulfurase / selenocysteine lyase
MKSSFDVYGTTRPRSSRPRSPPLSVVAPRTSPSATIAPMAYDPARARSAFPALAQRIHGHPLVYLDNAATTQAPRVVIEAVSAFSVASRANVHRGVHTLSERATTAYEGARTKVQHFLNARDAREIVFVRGTTEAINLVARTFGRARVGPGDHVVVTALEHHSNIVPWQMLCEERGASLRVIPVTDEGELRLDAIADLLGPRARMLAVAHVANAIGTLNPVRQICEIAHARGVPVLIDGAQAAAHLPIDVQEIGCDFYALSGHKAYGPTGIGALYGRADLLDAMPPFLGGGEMVQSVSWKGTTWAPVPGKFEAGTPNIEGAVGFGAAIDYLSDLDRNAVAAHEQQLLSYATEGIAAIPGARIIGRARNKAPIVSFTLKDVHAHDIGTVLDHHGVEIRAGHHCAQPLLERFGVPATARVSLALYNDAADIDALLVGLDATRELFR